jgi:hypothetical protein
MATLEKLLSFDLEKIEAMSNEDIELFFASKLQSCRPTPEALLSAKLDRPLKAPTKSSKRKQNKEPVGITLAGSPELIAMKKKFLSEQFGLKIA